MDKKTKEIIEYHRKTAEKMPDNPVAVARYVNVIGAWCSFEEELKVFWETLDVVPTANNHLTKTLLLKTILKSVGLKNPEDTLRFCKKAVSYMEKIKLDEDLSLGKKIAKILVNASEEKIKRSFVGPLRPKKTKNVKESGFRPSPE